MIERAISIRQPWAQAVVDGWKPIENRRAGFPRRHRGWLFVHASLGWSERGARDDRVRAHYSPAELARGTLAAGALIGYVDLEDVHDDAECCRPWGESEYEEHDGTRRADLVHLVFAHPVPFDEPIPCRGRLGLWTLPPEVLDLARAAAR